MTAPEQQRRRPRRRRRPDVEASAASVGHVVIGSKEIYDLLLRVDAKVTELARDRDALIEDAKQLRVELAALQARVSAMERWRHWITGAAAVAGGIVARLPVLGT